jgi:AcrR family transcriptional regulator
MLTSSLVSGRRAIDAAEKLSRREAILDAAGHLVSQDPNHLPSVAQVAQAAGLAKGTMYLYFETKEAIYLALHQRHTKAFFAALIEKLTKAKNFTLPMLLSVIDRHMIKEPSFFPLCTSCMSVAIHAVDPKTVQQFHEELGHWLHQAGQGLENRLPNLNPGDGVRMLHLGYAQMLGLYQLLGNSAGDARVIAHLREQQKKLGLNSFEVELRTAITLLWQQTSEHGLSRPKTKTKKRVLP